MQQHRIRTGKTKTPGVGKGGANKQLQEDEQFKHGIAFFRRERPVIKAERRYCERCDKDLIDAGPKMWTVHHKDHNHYNNDPANWELLCKRCHQLEHDCVSAFLKVQRPSRKGVGNSVPEAPASGVKPDEDMV